MAQGGGRCDHVSQTMNRLLRYNPSEAKKPLLNAQGGTYSALEEDYSEKGSLNNNNDGELTSINEEA